MNKINKIKAREVFDSRGNPTVEVDIYSDDGEFARAMVPSGASTGVHEALELRDGGDRFLGKGVQQAVENINKIAAKIIDREPNQTEIDNLMIELDGTDNKAKLGANAILGVSMAVCKLGAKVKGIPLYEHIARLANVKDYVLPVPSLNVINGGTHAGNSLDIQEYMMLPVGASSFREAMRMGAETYQYLKKIIKEKYGKDAINVGDEGGFAPPLQKPEEPIELILQAVEKAGYKGKIKIGLDSAASEFFEDGSYHMEGKTITAEDLIQKYMDMADAYPIVSYEDPFDEDDFKHHKILTEEIGDQVQIVGDDLLVTNPKRIKKAIGNKSVNALLLKVNQIGSITEAIKACKMAQDADWNVMVSHRSGETEDPFIADLVVGLKTGQIKSGAPCRSERLAKYNQLLRIEEKLGDKGTYAGINFQNL